MSMSFQSTGSFKKSIAFLEALQKKDPFSGVERFAEEGVRALSAATPVESGLAAASWGYVIERTKGRLIITWTNSDVEGGFPVAVMIQYGHGTGTGGYVEGIDYINPAMRPIFEKIADEVWKAVTASG